MTHVDESDRRFREGAGVRRLDDAEYEKVNAAFEAYQDTIPKSKKFREVAYDVKDIVGRTGFGIGSAGLPSYNVLIEGFNQALDNDIVLAMKQGNVAAPSRVVDDAAVHEYFKHHGHRTAVSQRALQAHADPLLGYTEIDGVGYVVAELSPYEADLDWSELTEPDELTEVIEQLGRAVAKVHCVGDADSDQELVEFQTEDAIAERIGDRDDEFVDDMVEFGLDYAKDGARRPSALRRGVPRGPDPRRQLDLSPVTPARSNRPRPISAFDSSGSVAGSLGDRAVEVELAAVAWAVDRAVGHLVHRAPLVRAGRGEPLELTGGGLGDHDVVDDHTRADRDVGGLGDRATAGAGSAGAVGEVATLVDASLLAAGFSSPRAARRECACGQHEACASNHVLSWNAANHRRALLNPLGGLGLQPSKGHRARFVCATPKSVSVQPGRTGIAPGRHQRADLDPSRVVLGRRTGQLQDAAGIGHVHR